MRARDNAEFSAFILASHNRSLRYATMLCVGDTHLAEDIVQTVELKLYGHWRRVNHRGDPTAYVRKAIYNEFISSRRKSSFKHERSVDALPDETEIATFEDWVVEVDELQRLLQLLPAQHRGVLVMRYLEDMTVGEVAQAMGYSEGHVKRLSADALRRMRDASGGYRAGQ